MTYMTTGESQLEGQQTFVVADLRHYVVNGCILVQFRHKNLLVRITELKHVFTTYVIR